MLITMYKDTAAGYGLCEDDGQSDNSVSIDVPKNTLDDYYNDIIRGSAPFQKWIDEEYIWDDMEDLLDYIIDTEGNLDSIKVVE